MNYTYHIAKRITIKSKRSFSKLIVKIAIGGISLGILVMLMSIGIIRGFKSTIKEKLNGFSGEIQVNAYIPNTFEKNFFIRRDPKVESKIKSNGSVNSMFSYATKVALLKIGNRVEPVVLKGVSDINAYHFLIQSIVEGKRIAENNDIVISKLIANKFNLKVNQTALFYFADQQIKIRKLKVVGIYETGITEYSSFEIRFRLNSTTPLAPGTGTFKFLTYLANTISFTHKNLSETEPNKSTFKIFASCIPKFICSFNKAFSIASHLFTSKLPLQRENFEIITSCLVGFVPN